GCDPGVILDFVHGNQFRTSNGHCQCSQLHAMLDPASAATRKYRPALDRERYVFQFQDATHLSLLITYDQPSIASSLPEFPRCVLLCFSLQVIKKIEF